MTAAKHFVHTFSVNKPFISGAAMFQQLASDEFV
jgi:hypothetical protein